MGRNIRAILGPTNTGKTHYAVERMLAHSSGMMGFPLRLLAREVYDRVVGAKGRNQAALITGEERIVPEGARYFLCTAEAMPRHMNVEFAALDEVQMAADSQRGHVFTDHMLNTRGRHETLLLGAETMRPLIRQLLPEADIDTRPRLSCLTHTKPVKLSRLPRRSAVVGFSVSEVYGMAELIRRQRGGAAIVMGALSPRTRNAQVAMYQSGEVDYLVATDAIGMGLNMDIDHVAFGSLEKFDGRLFRHLNPAEAAQIAGRAGRYKRDGTFSTLGGEGVMDPLMVAQIEDHQFDALRRLTWRNSRLDFTSAGRLIRSLEMPAKTEGLHRQRDATDLVVLKALSMDADIAGRVRDPGQVRLLWDVCQVPDFRKISADDHISLLRRIFLDLSGDAGVIEDGWIARQVKRLDNIHGDIDTLAGRIAGIRVWTYVSHRSGWLKDGAHWAHMTRSVEDRLSDALHDRLTQRFVDRRTAVLMRSLKQKDSLSVSIDSEKGTVSVEGHEVGTLFGFSFRVAESVDRQEEKTIRAATVPGLQAEMMRRAKLLANVGIKKVSLDFADGLWRPRVIWDGAPIARVEHSGALFAPRVRLMEDTLLEGDVSVLVLETVQKWLDERIADKLAPLMALSKELNGEVEPAEGTPPLSGLARGIAYRMLESYGVLPRAAVDSDLRQLDQDARKGLRRFGIRIGALSLYMPLILKPHATELRLMLWALARSETALPTIPTPGMVWVDTEKAAPEGFYDLAGFRVVGAKAVRIDMLERLADTVRPLGQDRSWFEVTPEIMGLVGLSGESFASVMKALGYAWEIRKLPPASAEATSVDKPSETDPDSPPCTPGEPVSGQTTDDSEKSAASTAPDQPTADIVQHTPDATEVPAVDTGDPSVLSPVVQDTPEQTPAPTADQPVSSERPDADAGLEDTEARKTASDADAIQGDSGPEDAVPPAADTDEASAELVERYVFKWAPSRGRRHGGGRSSADTRDGERQSRGGQARKRPQNSHGRPKSARGARDNSAKSSKPGKDTRRVSRPRRSEKQADPDSPFAALAGLKEALDKKAR